ncbi:MAG: SGNH/GDSL hydrolase family protein [Candidatus Omnitrophica bacterium]|nr:SGNH/GDSL hydrolase family protein [Candidatus Omnitrophota bacterium]
MRLHKVAAVFKVVMVVLVTSVVFLASAEFILRNFTSYGIEYFTSFTNNNRIIGGVIYDSYLAEIMGKFVQDCKSGKNKKPIGAYRVMVLGDSIVRGGELKKGESAFPELLKEMLQEKYAGTKFEFLVLAAGGWSTVEEVSEFARYAGCFLPDLVILAYCHNDAAESSQRIRKLHGRSILAYYKTDIVYVSQIPFNRYLTERFLIFRLINKSLVDFIEKHKLPLRAEYVFLARTRIHEQLRKLYVLTHEISSRVLVVIFPYLEEAPDRNRFLMTHLIKSWDEAFHFLTLDLSFEFNKYPYRQLQCTATDPVHPNALGHSIAAREIMSVLEQNYKNNISR